MPTKIALLAAIALTAAASNVRYSRNYDDRDPNTGKIHYYDLPPNQRLENKPGSDGLGLCVFTSIDHAARWQRLPELIGLRDYMTAYPGGGYPTKVQNVLSQKAPGFNEYLQAEGEAALPLVEWALRNYRLPCSTYGYGERYGSVIAHMLNPVYLDQQTAGVLDNNWPDTIEWMDRADYAYRIRNNGAWSFVLTTPPPPPIPVNKATR